MDGSEQNSNQVAAEVESIPEIDAAIAADEAQWAEEEARQRDSDVDGGAADGQRRDPRTGRFTGANDAEEPPHPSPLPQGGEGEENAGEGANSDGRRAAGAAQGGGSDDGKGSTTANQQSGKQGQQQQAGAGADGKSQMADGKGALQQQRPTDSQANGQQSAYQKEQARKQNSWEAINREKQTIAQEREQLKLEREQLTAQQQASNSQQRDASGHSAADYERVATAKRDQIASLQAQALKAEQAGDFARADALNAEAEKAHRVYQAATARVEEMRNAGTNRVWQNLAADLPEVLQVDGQVNREIRQVLRSNPQFLSDPMGPFRAAVVVGRKLLQAQATELQSSKTEAAKVPGLLKQVEELSQKVAELTRLTSLPGGSAALSREGSEGRSWNDLSVEEMEARLSAEAGALG